jgi:hypothetical protein
MIDIAFTYLGFNFLHSHYLKANNVPSGAILLKHGFVPDNSRADVGVEGRFEKYENDVWTFVKLNRDDWVSGKRLTLNKFEVEV